MRIRWIIPIVCGSLVGLILYYKNKNEPEYLLGVHPMYQKKKYARLQLRPGVLVYKTTVGELLNK